MSVYKAIANVMADISTEGIAKTSKNQQQGYNFRGIDAVYNALSPILARHGLVILPRVVEREFVERQTAAGKPIFYTTIAVEFDFVSAEDGSKHTIKTYGEAMDSADKSCNKAMSAAYKYACMQAFCIPTEGDNDADAQTHTLASEEEVYKALVIKYTPSIDAIKDGIATGNLSSACEAWQELPEEVKHGLWKAPAKGGVFTTQERTVMKSAEFRESFFGVEK
jgi:hypothetical protein